MYLHRTDSTVFDKLFHSNLNRHSWESISISNVTNGTSVLLILTICFGEVTAPADEKWLELIWVKSGCYDTDLRAATTLQWLFNYLSWLVILFGRQWSLRVHQLKGSWEFNVRVSIISHEENIQPANISSLLRDILKSNYEIVLPLWFTCPLVLSWQGYLARDFILKMGKPKGGYLHDKM